MFDDHANLAVTTVATAPSPANTGTSLIVQAGFGALFPTPPFNAIVWPAFPAQALFSNAEIVRVTAGPPGSDTFTITRMQEGTSARNILIGDQICAPTSKKTLTDIEGSIPLSGSLALGNAVSSGTVSGLGLAFTPSRVLASVSRPAGGLLIFACVDPSSITSGGFTFELSALTDSTAYVLDYILCP
jgi:hypothetical protein